MTGLEALEKIDHTVCLNNLAKNIVWNIDKEENCDCESVEQFVDCYDTIEKELKVLEIIKNKKVDIRRFIQYTHNLFDYNAGVWNELTQQEYDLLKEVLL